MNSAAERERVGDDQRLKKRKSELAGEIHSAWPGTGRVTPAQRHLRGFLQWGSASTHGQEKAGEQVHVGVEISKWE